MVLEKEGSSWGESTSPLVDPLLPADLEDRGSEVSNNAAPIRMVEVTAPADLAEGERFDTRHNGRTVTLVVPSGGVKRGDKFLVPEPTRVTKVVCPASVMGGAEIDVWVNGKKVTVTVPPGGAKRGETFEVPDPLEDTPSSAESPSPPSRERRSRRARTTTSTDRDDDSDNRRQWRDGLLDCFSLGVFHPSLCMSFWCPLIAVGQLLTRLKLNWLGQRRSSNQSAILILALLSLAAMKVDLFFSLIVARSEDLEVTVASRVFRSIFSWGLFIFWVVVLYNIRRFVRERDGISPHQACPAYLKILFCPTLVTAQLMRHTAYYPEHKGAYFTLDGLAQQESESSDPPANIV